MLKIWEVEEAEQGEEGDQWKAGDVVKVEKDRFLVKTGQGVLAVLEVQLEGKKRMRTDAFLRGYCVEVGMHLES